MSNIEQHDYSKDFSSAERNKKLFLEKLDGIQAWLSQRDISYRVLGNLAVTSYIDPSLDSINFDRQGAFSKDQRVPDIDLLVQKQDIPQVFDYGKTLLRDPSFPVRLDLVAGIKHIDLRADSETSYLSHKNLSISFDTRVFDQATRPLGSTQINTVDPLTLQHTFEVWGGTLREKDLPRVRALIRYNREEEASIFSESDFQGFHEFLRERGRKYPFYSRIRKAEIAVNTMLPEKVENFLRVIYKNKDARGGKI